MGDKCRSRKSGREKLENPPEGLPKVITVPKEWEKRMGRKRVLVPTPLMVDGLLRKVRRGKLVTVGQLRERLATEFDADSTCHDNGHILDDCGTSGGRRFAGRENANHALLAGH